MKCCIFVPFVSQFCYQDFNSAVHIISLHSSSLHGWTCSLLRLSPSIFFAVSPCKIRPEFLEDFYWCLSSWVKSNSRVISWSSIRMKVSLAQLVIYTNHKRQGYPSVDAQYCHTVALCDASEQNPGQDNVYFDSRRRISVRWYPPEKRTFHVCRACARRRVSNCIQSKSLTMGWHISYTHQSLLKHREYQPTPKRARVFHLTWHNIQLCLTNFLKQECFNDYRYDLDIIASLIVQC